jgi:hypothetical protein
VETLATFFLILSGFPRDAARGVMFAPARDLTRSPPIPRVEKLFAQRPGCWHHSLRINCLVV